MTAVFNSNAFDSNAFECGVSAGVGWFPEWDIEAKLLKHKKRHSVEHLSSMLAQQQQFGPKQYQQFLDDIQAQLTKEWYDSHLEGMQARARAKRNRARR